MSDTDHELERKDAEIAAWIAYADKLENIIELVCAQSKDQLTRLHAEQGLRIVRPNGDR